MIYFHATMHRFFQGIANYFFNKLYDRQANEAMFDELAEHQAKATAMVMRHLTNATIN